MNEILLSNGKSASNSNKYISSVSGGSWFSWIYLFAKESVDNLLGVSIPIVDINNEKL